MGIYINIGKPIRLTDTRGNLRHAKIHGIQNWEPTQFNFVGISADKK